MSINREPLQQWSSRVYILTLFTSYSGADWNSESPTGVPLSSFGDAYNIIGPEITLPDPKKYWNNVPVSGLLTLWKQIVVGTREYFDSCS